MCRKTSTGRRNSQHSHLLALAAWVLTLLLSPSAGAQIYLSPNQQYPQRPRGTLDLGGGVRCSFEGGAAPSLSMSVGAYPDTLFNDVVIGTSNSVANQSSMFGLITLNIPLGQKNHQFSCNDLMKDVQLRTRLQSLRELVDENIISESQYKQAAAEAYQKFLKNGDTTTSLTKDSAGSTGIKLAIPQDKPSSN